MTFFYVEKKTNCKMKIKYVNPKQFPLYEQSKKVIKEKFVPYI